MEIEFISNKNSKSVGGHIGEPARFVNIAMAENSGEAPALGTLSVPQPRPEFTSLQ